ncbi:MAG TPA: ABC-F family ATP-binding cassette domain-containing protein, partial [Spirochaetia bacterium]
TLVDAPLFEQVTLGIDAGERIGFIGRNGAGKSTFLKILDGELFPDTGSVSRNRELTISRLEQRPDFAPGISLEQAVDPSVAAIFLSYCRELGLVDPAARLDAFSGGMLRKASIARCLARQAGLVLLDEPTNHLDIETIEWLEGRLKAADFGFILVTHDRYFLDGVCDSIMEIDDRRIVKYPGNYSEYLDRRAEREEMRERAENRRISILRGELEWLKRGPRARTGKDRSRKARIQDLRDSALQREMAMAEFSSTHRRLGTKVLEIQGAAKVFDGRAVISPFTYSFRRGERIGIIGPNGSGKTTFLRLVAGELAPDSGAVVPGATTVFGHFAQSNPPIAPGLTVIEFMKQLAERIPQEKGGSLSAEQFLERFLFPRSMHGVTVDRLSGGEMRRLTLVRLLATAPNFLLFDEPTNDLDLDTIRLLEDYLADFGGCILLVSHDRALLDRLTDYLFVFDGVVGIRGFAGSYEEYRALAAEGEAAERKEAARQAAPRGQRRSTHTEKTGLTFKERKEYEGLLERIGELEREQKDLEASFQEASPDPLDLERKNRRYREVLAELEKGMARWEELAARAGV